MRYQEAAAIGRGLGLEHPAEFINNVVLHSTNIFPYSVIRDEVSELIADAKANGVRFSEVCGDAVLEEDPTDQLCYICKKISEATQELPQPNDGTQDIPRA